MQRRLRIFGLFILLLYLLFGLQYGVWQPGTAVAPPPAAAPRARLLLVPLDSRPPCRDFVRDAAALVDYEIILPPTQLMDYYSAPGDTQGMQRWLKDKLSQADMAIISLDQLLSGGLLASREGHASPDRAAALLSYLRELHAAHPTVKLHAFSILPRLLPPDSIDGATERKALLHYSRLTDKIALQGKATDEQQQELAELREQISTKSLQHYESLYRHHRRLCEELLRLVQEGVLDRLVIGRDDGEKLGLPNLEARQLAKALEQSGLPPAKATLTYGADELALSMLAGYAAQQAGFVPRIALAYNDQATVERLMPYMAGSMAATAEEKIALTGAVKADSAAADFTLFLSAVGRDNLSSRRPAAQTVKDYLTNGQSVALVDLSEHFTLEETLLPQLLRQRVPLQQLTAYAGWNTASNSIGTAVAQAVLVLTGERLAKDETARLRLTSARLKLLNQRLLEDGYYLKDVIDKVNYSLRRAGYFDVNDLDMDHNYRWANAMLQSGLAQRRQLLELSPAFRRPYYDRLTDTCFTVQRLQEEVYFPWPRTFEVNLQLRPEILLSK